MYGRIIIITYKLDRGSLIFAVLSVAVSCCRRHCRRRRRCRRCHRHRPQSRRSRRRLLHRAHRCRFFPILWHIISRFPFFTLSHAHMNAYIRTHIRTNKR